MDQAGAGKKMTKRSPFVSELLNRLEDLESRLVKQERTIDQMQSKILQQEKQIEDLNQHFEDLLKECESFADFMPIFDEKTRLCSQRVKAVESELRKVGSENSQDLRRVVEDQTSRLDSLGSSINDLLKFKDVTKSYLSNFLHSEPRPVAAETNLPSMVYHTEPPVLYYPNLSYSQPGYDPGYYPAYYQAPSAPPDFQPGSLYTVTYVLPLPRSNN